MQRSKPTPPNIRIGIDPGITGAIAFLDNDDLSFIKVENMPIMANGKKNQVNPYALSKMMESLPANTPVFLERVSAMPGQGVTSMFSFGMSFGIIQGVCAGLFLPIHLVTPQSWKKRAGLIGKDKDMARTLAQQLYPTAPLSRKKDIGRADSILIARFGELV
jgi:crossover junction endodeoxyribonuclease RuvC